MMDYMDIIPTHNSLRNLDSFKALVADPGLILKAERPPLILNVEGQTYLNDGHHRLTAAIYVGIPLSDIKLQFATYSYAQMMAPNFKIGWLTPYDPRTHVRRNYCLQFKEWVRKILMNCGKTVAMTYMENTTSYLETRIATSLKDLIPNGFNHCK